MTLLEQLLPFTTWELLSSIPTWVLMAAPIVSTILTWHIAHVKHKFDKANTQREWESKDADRQRAERANIHIENAEQTKAWTERFTRLMNGYDARVDDLMSEVVQLRSEVVQLRKVIDWQRTACTGCPTLAKIILVGQPTTVSGSDNASG